MFSLKTSGLIAIAAFLLSFCIGLINRAAMPMIILRPIIFAVLFFVITNLIYFLVNRFLPELLAGGAAADAPDLFPGSRINIMEGDSPEDAPAGVEPVFMGAQADDSDEGLGNISDLPRKNAGSGAPGLGIQGIGSGMDQNAESGYNDAGKLEELPEQEPFVPWDPLSHVGGGLGPGAFAQEGRAASEKPQAPPKPYVPDMAPGSADGSDSVDFFPDLDSMAGAFIPTPMSEGADAAEHPVSHSKRPSRSNKAPAWSEDFNAKDMAMGLRTVLNKEKEG